MIKNEKTRYIFWGGVVCILMYYIPVLWLGQNSHVIIHDNLDGEFIYRIWMTLDGSDKYNNGMIWQVMNGLPRDYLQTSLNMTVLFFQIFSPFIAYIVNDILARLIAYAGMFLLLKQYVLSETWIDQRTKFLVMVCSLLFALIPIYTVYGGLTVMGQPLLFWSFLNLWNNKNSWFNYAIIVLFPFCSSFYLSGFFICVVLSLVWMYGLCVFKRVKKEFLIGLILLGVVYCLTEYRMIFSVLFEKSQSHRLEFSSMYSWMDILYETLKLLFVTQYHSGVFTSVPCIIMLLVLLFLNKGVKLKTDQVIILCIGSILILNMIYLYLFKQTDITIIRIFQWNRFYFLLPGLWIVLLASVSNQLLYASCKKPVYCQALVISMIAVSFLYVLNKNEEFKGNVRELAGKFFMKENRTPSFARFFSPALFDQIKDYIGRDQSEYRVICLGVHPSVAIYNGFFTLDSYQTSYPLEYKHQFRRIICRELDKDPDLKKYFDNWGSRCYMYASELKRNCMVGKYDTISVKSLDIDVPVLQEMGAAYIFSAVEIQNANQLNLSMEKVFEDENSYWRIYLYKIG